MNQGIKMVPAPLHRKNLGKPFSPLSHPLGHSPYNTRPLRIQIHLSLSFKIGKKIEQLILTESPAEKQGRNIFNMVGLIKNYAFVAGQHLTMTILSSARGPRRTGGD